MKIKTDVLKIKYKKPLNLDYIKKHFKEIKKSPVRWGITSITECELVISYSYLG